MIDSGAHDGADDQEPGILAYLPAIAWQRRKWLLIPLLIGSIAGLAAAFLLPATYRTSATLLVEAPQITTDSGASKGENPIDQRMARIRQQLLSRPDLIELIEANNLYPARRGSEPMSKLIQRMRDATTLKAVNAEIGGARDTDTVAFTLTYDYPDAQLSQLVAQSFVERLVTLDSTANAERAAGTVNFLQDQATTLQTQIAALERQIEALKANNGAALASTGTTLMSLGGGNYEVQIASLQRENAQLAAQIELQASAVDRDPTVMGAMAQLAAAQAIYSDSHPDVRAARRRLAEARQFARQTQAQSAALPTLRAQLAANQRTIAQLSSARAVDQSRSSAVIARQSRAPLVAEQVAQLESRAVGLRANYQAISTNLLNARAAAKIDSQRRGERLAVIDPPVIADRPNWPNRPLLIAGGILGGLAFGMLVIVLMELAMRPIRGVDAVRRITGAVPLVAIPTLGQRRRWWSRLRWRRRAETTA